jgi:phosphatidate cytidylyltransferase
MSKWADLGVRSASAIVLAPVVVAAVWAGGTWYTAFIASLGVLMAWEWTNIVHNGDAKPFALHAIAATSAALLVPYASILIVAFSAASLCLTAYPAKIESAGLQPLQNNIRWKALGVPYVAFPILALALLRRDPEWGVYALIWCIAIVWAADIAAYFAGRLIGGPKLAPKLSPKKTWAGMAGAVIGAALASFIFTSYFQSTHWPLAIFAALFAILEQGGDILESALKRQHNVKDSSNLIPGHGGILDRADGLIAVILAATLVGYLHNSQSAAQGLLLW